ncbi:MULTISPECIES: type II toxin-antitoxin system HipA family toxin [Bifidobacterium]|jgi:serine/threonine-protein kinase HipA|uniref:Type II toxin-antitoxin system HipA family toxin n=1 Tax=Bifidobacterium tibiigranuli TaxID=2172043 RepID=A0A5N6S712_9BIFI|nr:type II toxin-antitoxin system HipA family toxin [Bifidobacterium tibiigranuli]KAE8130286.1 type II toxin-antitoxin system HipA family toxin [Bifidobacterium tibiigranuli]KAE8130355.1 type II toxin-antitoxin system HipA family toxin [Bifidobacterium tibiigranuli]MCH3974790.1 HipA domain-containing protein [Bifidobacterium tibiigranuli]MCH4189038.1 HipA domain-containing protein [Bifidobacterium tibiigranuli]MCH4203758.1 HipA domain-containing protein [Bifidobacterium tibiigranuli]
MAKKTIEATVLVTLDSGKEAPAGTLYATGNDLSFRYAADYVTNPQAFDMFPSMPRSLAPFYFSGLGQFSDSAPDRWGRKVFARSLNRTRVSESEYLFGVNDLTRQGAVRFIIDGKPVAGDEGVPVLANMPELLNTADAVEQNRDVSDISLRRLYRATGSLGGARPKASVFDRNALWLAKFPKPNGDAWDVIGWEAVTLEIARLIGINVPEHRTITVKDANEQHRTVLLIKRFDRKSAPSIEEMERIPYMSAMTALDSTDGEGGDWLDLAEFTRRIGADTVELWRRAMFGAAIGNLDDHLRNHGYLRIGRAWQLAPAFDMNPEPYEADSPDMHQLSLFGDAAITTGKLLSADSLKLFGATRSYADQWLATLRSGLAQTLARASLRRLDAHSINVMAERFNRGMEALA